jgi:hypothetical protein
MAITNLLIKLKPEEIPEYMRGKFFELSVPKNWKDDPFYADADLGDSKYSEYVGWVHIKEDGTIEFGEPGV